MTANAEYILSFDLGTSSFKAAIYDVKGQIVGSAQQPCKLVSPQIGWAEQDPDDWWDKTSILTKTLLHKTLISPGQVANQFIPVMEDTGMITSLSEWVIEEACRQGRAWLDAGLDFGRVAINLSPSEIRRGGVVERLAEILVRTGLPPQYLEIEITEGLLLDQSTDVMKRLWAIKSLGVSVAMDDFGTGYSSLSFLNSFSAFPIG